MERDYTILRDLVAFPRDPFGGPIRALGVDAPPAPHIDVATLDKTALRDVARDRSVRAVAPVMPTRLIFPVPSPGAAAEEGAAAAGPTWGVRAVGADRSSFTGAGVTVSVLDTG